jgi:hypothetical protein
MQLEQGSSPKVSFLMRWEIDPFIAIDNRAVSIAITKNASTSTPISRTITQLGFGVYSVQLTEADTSDLGKLLIVCTAAHAKVTIIDAAVVRSKLDSVLNEPLTNINPDRTTIGGYVTRSLMTLRKYLALSKIA